MPFNKNESLDLFGYTSNSYLHFIKIVLERLTTVLLKYLQKEVTLDILVSTHTTAHHDIMDLREWKLPMLAEYNYVFDIIL